LLVQAKELLFAANGQTAIDLGGFILFSGAFVFLPARRFVELPSRRVDLLAHAG
jgi:hypothetical protein